MSVLGGAGRVESTVSDPDFAPVSDRRTRYPLPGFTLRNSSPPSESARFVAIVRPALPRSDICALGSRPVTYTCSTLPCALKLAAAAFAAEAPAAVANVNAIVAAARRTPTRARLLETQPLLIPRTQSRLARGRRTSHEPAARQLRIGSCAAADCRTEAPPRCSGASIRSVRVSSCRLRGFGIAQRTRRRKRLPGLQQRLQAGQDHRPAAVELGVRVLAQLVVRDCQPAGILNL